jgi:hypothetical protein
MWVSEYFYLTAIFAPKNEMLKYVGVGIKTIGKQEFVPIFVFFSLQWKNLPMRIKLRQELFQLAVEQ